MKGGRFEKGSRMRNVKIDANSSYGGRKTTKEVIEETNFWSQFGWAIVAESENRNMDRVPANVVVDFPCPVCGSAWGELDALGFNAPRVYSGRIQWLGGMPVLYPNRPNPETYFRAVRLVCLDGHRVEHDSITKRQNVVQVPPELGVLLGIGLMAVSFGLLCMQEK